MAYATERQATENTARLGENPYPGRGIIIGKPATNFGVMQQVYWLMGRKANSQNRVFVEDRQTGIIRTQAFDPSKVTDPSLIIYNAMRSLKADGSKYHVVSNGHQTDTVAAALASEEGVIAALLPHFETDDPTRTFEPDAPNYTPRITAVTRIKPDGEVSHHFHTVRKSTDSDDPLHRLVPYQHTEMEYGVGLCLHTYAGDSPSEGDPIPSYIGAPYPVLIGDTPSSTADYYWDRLNPANRVALVVKELSLLDDSVSYVFRDRFNN